ncbi:MAG: heat-inducible transcription repressor HrcA [Bryobacteraceae bacterium]|nr:heat-inducible transcription repressor HrcA [Bryobacteraceae bacterium]
MVDRKPSRSMNILHAIVQAHIETGEPVASRTISRRWSGGALSPASIRNVMADLCDEGYLAQPHTSAGRVPTAKAYESYVRSIAEQRVLRAELQRIRTELSRLDTMEDRVELSCHILTEMTRNVGIAAAIPTSGQTLDQIELLTLGEQRVLMIVVTRDRMIRNRVVALEEPVSQDELNSIRNYINRNFSGWILADVKEELKSRLEAESAAYDEILKKLILLYDKGLLNLSFNPEVHLEGTSNLVGVGLQWTRETMRALFHALEEKKRILELLEQFMEKPEGEVAVQVGLGGAHPDLGEFSLIGLNVRLPSGLSAKIAVLGPMRMDYGNVISAVQHVGRAIQSLPV